MRFSKQDIIVLTVLCNLVVLALLLASSNREGTTGAEEVRGFSSPKVQKKAEVETQIGTSSEMDAVSFD